MSPGENQKVELGREDTLLSCFLRHHDANKDAVFAHFVEETGERALGRQELLRRAASFAALLEARGVKPRATVFVLAPLGPDLLAAFVGGLLARALPALLSYPSSKVAPDVYARNLRGVLETTGAETVLTTRALEAPLREALGERARALHWLEDAAPVSDDALAARLATIAQVPPDEVAFLQHSSGSTGLQKGVALSHRSVLNQLRAYSKAIALDPAKDRIASWLPLYHDMGLIATFLLPLATGTPVVFMDPFRWVTDPALLLEAIARHRSTLAWLPNFAYVHLAKRVPARRLEGLDLSSVRGLVNCSEPVRDASHRAFLERYRPLGIDEGKLWVSYAMAENTFAVTETGPCAEGRVDRIDAARLASEGVATPQENGLAVVSCGPPIEGCTVKVVDERRQTVPDRTVGELALRSDSMLTEYHANPEATKAALEGGFYFTGDLGYVAEGHVHVTGRKKDLIIVGGRNFYPQDLEDLAAQEAGVVPGRVVAFGVANEDTGTEEVVLVAETELEDEAGKVDLRRRLQRAALERLDCALGRTELVPRGWIVKTSSGKVARKANVEKWRQELAAVEKAPSPAGAAPAPAPLAASPVARETVPLVLQVLFAALVLALAVVLRPNEAVVLYQGF